ncbi:MAG: hypothetical protein JWP10_1055 [Nocardioidaceae bacterium]|nr:hypothetical protein [Nocardioidaceae bacterium]
MKRLLHRNPERNAEVVRRAVVSLLWFGAVSALIGCVMAFTAVGDKFKDSLAGTPFASAVVPGIILGVVVGGSQAWGAVAARRPKDGGLLAPAIAGFGMMIWIFAEIALLGEYSWLQTVYFVVGIAELTGVLALLGIAPAIVWSATTKTVAVPLPYEDAPLPLPDL